MTIEKGFTAEEIAKSYAILLHNYINGDDKIEDASAISEAAVKNVKGNIDDFLDATTLLGPVYQAKLIEFIERMIASSYLAALAEAITKKQEHQFEQLTIKG
jgi:hypothetical protein